MAPRHPDTTVELPDGADHTTIVTAVGAALRGGGHDDDAEAFERQAASSDLPALNLLIRDWVTVSWQRDASAAMGGSTQRSSTLLSTPMPGATRWQHAVVNIGMFHSGDRMATVLAEAGSAGWELVAVYDKASNWLNGMENGFMLLKRPVPDDVEPASWTVTLRG